MGACPLPLEVLRAIEGVHIPHLREKKATGTLSTVTPSTGFVIEFQTPKTKITNTVVLSRLVMAGAQIVTVTCETRSLEEVYASAMNDEDASPMHARQPAIEHVGASLADNR